MCWNYRSLIWTVPLFDRTVNWFSIPAKNWLHWLLTWTDISLLIDDLNLYSCKILFDLWLWTWTVISVQLFEFWSMNWINIPAKLLTWTVIPERAFEFWSMNWSNIPAKLLTWTVIPEQTNEFSSMIWIVARMFEFWSMVWIVARMFDFWTIDELIQYSATIIPERTFEFWSSNPATFVWLNFVTVVIFPRVCASTLTLWQCLFWTFRYTYLPTVL